MHWRPSKSRKNALPDSASAQQKTSSPQGDSVDLLEQEGDADGAPANGTLIHQESGVEEGPKAATPSSPAASGGEAQDSARPWRMGLVVAASALCGGIAVVLWNRRTLTRMREAPLAEETPGSYWEDSP